MRRKSDPPPNSIFPNSLRPPTDGDVEGFLDDPSKHPRVREAWRPYVRARLGFRNHWYPALFSKELTGDEPKAIKLLGEKILLRRIDGKAYAVEDRCAHRRVPFSPKIECYTKETITCWYHGFTYDWRDGRLVQVLTEPGCVLVGKMSIKTYVLEEVKGIIFIFVGDIDPPPLHDDLPPWFLDEDVALGGIHRDVKSNWRMGVENGFDTTHIYMHRQSKFIRHSNALLPLGLVPSSKHAMEIVRGPGPKGIIDKLAENYMPVFESSIGPVTVAAIAKPQGTPVAYSVSVWLPCALRVEAFPAPDITQFEFYVPIDDTNHTYWQVLGRRVSDDTEASAFQSEVDSYWTDMSLTGFNDDDIWAREALEDAYTDGEGWVRERLFRPDTCIIEWRRLASEFNRGIQRIR